MILLFLNGDKLGYFFAFCCFLVGFFLILDIFVCCFVMDFSWVRLLLLNCFYLLLMDFYIIQRADSQDSHDFLCLKYQSLDLLWNLGCLIFEMKNDIHLNFKLVHEFLSLLFLLLLFFHRINLFLDQ